MGMTPIAIRKIPGFFLKDLCTVALFHHNWHSILNDHCWTILSDLQTLMNGVFNFFFQWLASSFLWNCFSVARLWGRKGNGGSGTVKIHSQLSLFYNVWILFWHLLLWSVPVFVDHCDASFCSFQGSRFNQGYACAKIEYVEILVYLFVYF